MNGDREDEKDRYPTPPESIRGPLRMYPTEPLDTSEEIRRLAPSRATVLVVGGGRVAQARVARALHERSARASAPFVAVDCEVVAPDDVEVALFGGPCYVAEARGAVHAAHGGTLYVAAVHDLPLPLQPRFLAYLDQSLSSRGRVVVSTDVELIQRARAARFRRDLAERLDLVRVVLEPV
ncbi:MAG: sigma 54-interacting transcriptional regulator [Labilithrix sp.]